MQKHHFIKFKHLNQQADYINRNLTSHQKHGSYFYIHKSN